MRVSGSHSRSSVYRSCTFKRSNRAEDKYFEFYGKSERIKYTHAIRQTPRIAK